MVKIMRIQTFLLLLLYLFILPLQAEEEEEEEESTATFVTVNTGNPKISCTYEVLSKLDAQSFFGSPGPIDASPDDYILYKYGKPLYEAYSVPIVTNYCSSNEFSNLHNKYCLIAVTITNNSNRTLIIRKKIEEPTAIKSDKNDVTQNKKEDVQYLLFNTTNDGKTIDISQKKEIVRRELLFRQKISDIKILAAAFSLLSLAFGGIFLADKHHFTKVSSCVAIFNAFLWSLVFFCRKSLGKTIEQITQEFENIDGNSCISLKLKDDATFSLDTKAIMEIPHGSTFTGILAFDRSTYKNIDSLLNDSSTNPTLKYEFKEDE